MQLCGYLTRVSVIFTGEQWPFFCELTGQINKLKQRTSKVDKSHKMEYILPHCHTSLIRCSTGCTRIPTGAENRRTGAEETEWSGRQRQREPEEFHSQTRSEQIHQECTKRSPTLEAVHVPRSGGGAGTPGACRTRIEVRAALGSTGTAT